MTERRKPERELEDIFNLSSDLIAVCTAEGEFLRLSPSWENVLGYTIDEILNLGWAKLVHPDDVERTDNEVEKPLAGHSVMNYTNRFRCKDGTYRKLEWRATPAEKGIVYATARDITEREKAEEELRESEERHRTLFETMVQGVIYHDAEGAVISMNPAAERIMGPGVSEWRASGPERRGWKVVREDGSAFARNEYPLAIAMNERKEVRNVVMGIRDPNGNDRAWFSTSVIPMFRPGEDKPYRFHSISEDITERRQAEQALRESESRYRALAENSLAGIFVSDARRFIYVNPRLCEITGFSEAELMNMRDPLGSLLVPDERERLMAHARSRLDGKAAPAEYDARGLRKDGAEIVLRLAVSAVELSGTRVLQGTVEDITERRQAEEELTRHRQHLEELVGERTGELRNAQEELVRKERLALMGQLAGGVGHELRNPLGAIKNVAYYLKMVLKQPEPRVAESLNQMERAVARADGIIISLLNFAGQRPPTLLSGNVNDAVREALSLVEMPENVEVATRLDDTLPLISLDPGQLGQVFENLIVNAVQSMVDGGRLTVRSERSGAGWVAVSIADTGVGLSPEDLAKVFQPLFTTRARGIGLGLAISKTIVEAHGGSIEAQSKPGAGSTFTVWLPA